ncbi:hypothetical protein GCM10027052_18380 [Parafrigoribacterium mesophilum]|uniref:hypothetical protein n=1 Tax=Parafrigoribacterium mesophilum TaxID=433646 RepID=UPI0031FDA539
MSRLWSPQQSPLRWPAALFLMVNAAIHLYLTPMHLVEAPYIGALFIALSAACIILAVLVTFFDNLLVWTATGAMSLLALMAFLISRTIGMPQIRDDIGNWTDPLGYPDMVVEILTVTVALVVLRSWRLAAPATRYRSPRE